MKREKEKDGGREERQAEKEARESKERGVGKETGWLYCLLCPLATGLNKDLNDRVKVENLGGVQKCRHFVRVLIQSNI